MKTLGKQLFFGTLLTTCFVTTIHAATITQLQRMLNVTQHRGGKVSPALRNSFDITKEEFWRMIIRVDKQTAQNKIETLTGNKQLDLYFESYTNDQITNILLALKNTKTTDLNFESINNKNVNSPLLENTLTSLPHLTKLYLQFKNLDPWKLSNILKALNNKSITELLLCEDFFGFGYNNDELFDTLANTLATLPKLTTLQFNYFALSQEKFENILKSLQKTSITKLTLISNNLIKVTSFDNFKNLPKLTRLQLNYCDLNESQIRHLLKVLPETTVEYLEIGNNPGIKELENQNISYNIKNKNKKIISIKKT